MKTYLINHERYGEPCSFESLEQAEQVIRECGPEFAKVELREIRGIVYDERDEQVGTVEG